MNNAHKFLLSGLMFLGCSLLSATTGLVQVSEPSMELVKINTKPDQIYSDQNRSYNMVLGADMTPNGRIWAAWIGGGDGDIAYLIAATSEDGGYKWSKPALVVDPHRYDLERQGVPQRRALVGNFWTDPTGRLWLFYDQSLGYFDGRAGVWAAVCNDPDTKRPSWSFPKRLFHGAVLNKPIVTANGDWLIFASLWQRKVITAQFSEGHHNLDQERGINVYRSTDMGRSWNRISVVSIDAKDWLFDEPSVVELKNGDLWMLIRTGYGIAETYSEDGGVHWSRPVRSNISTPSSRVFLRRLTSGNLLLVKNGRLIDANSGRSELTAFVSTDDGRRWKGGLVLDERSPVSYPDGFQAKDGRIYVFYDRDRAGEAEILMSVFTENEIMEGKFDTANDRRRVIVSKGTKPQPLPSKKK